MDLRNVNLRTGNYRWPYNRVKGDLDFEVCSNTLGSQCLDKDFRKAELDMNHSTMSGHIHNYEIEHLQWFHPGLTRHQAECVLMQNGADGSYLMRPSRKDGYAVSVRGKDSVKHFELTYKPGDIKFGMTTFKTVLDMVKHFEERPLMTGETGVLVVLKNPYPRDIEEPGVYETVKVHGVFGSDKGPAGPAHAALNSKEGFLTKRGGKVKNWKTRWFVLVKNCLSYYKTSSDKDPVRTLDLNECSKCSREFDLGKNNCFQLVFPFRTFYIYAATEEEMHEWMNLIQWKLTSLKKEDETA